MSKTLTKDGVDHHFKGNGHTRRLWSWSDIPEKARGEFDYLDQPDRMNDDARFFEYRGSWYDLYEFEYAKDDGIVSLLGFEAYQTESAFSAVLAQRHGYDEVIVGYLHW